MSFFNERPNLITPNLVIIGAMKAGTTSLHYYLNLHPEISMSKVKEPAFFIEERNWRKGIKRYSSLFTNQTSVVGEASTEYTKYPHFKEVPAKMHSTIPEAKLIYLVRDPIVRILSEYMHKTTPVDVQVGISTMH